MLESNFSEEDKRKWKFERRLIIEMDGGSKLKSQLFDGMLKKEQGDRERKQLLSLMSPYFYIVLLSASHKNAKVHLRYFISATIQLNIEKLCLTKKRTC